MSIMLFTHVKMKIVISLVGFKGMLETEKTIRRLEK